jgi:zinc transport system substrate-binding protein
LALLCALCASRAEAGVRVVTSFYPLYVATRNVTRDVPGVELSNLAGPRTGCLHDYQMTPQDLTRLSRADVFIVNGAGMEAFLDKVVRQLPRLKIVDASRGIALLKNADGTANPHVFVSPTLHARQVRAIAEGLSGADPAHAEGFRKNGAAYAERLDALAQKMRKELAGARGRAIVTFHEAFPYFAQELGLTVAAVIEREPGSEPSARDLAQTIRVVREAKVTALFAEPQYSAKAASAIARETGATVRTLDPVVTGPDRDDAYLAAMEQNLATLREALR